MTEILATVGSMDELKRVVSAGANAVTIGESRWGMRLPGDFLLPEIAKAAGWAKERQAKIYVAVNKILDNEEIRDLPDYIEALSRTGADAVVFGDSAVLTLARRLAPSLALHWNAEMTSTNYATAEYWHKRGASRVVLARELNMEQVLEFKRNTRMEIQVQVHGATNIYHSRRNLIRSYMEYHDGKAGFAGQSGQDDEFGLNRRLYLIEEERGELHLPIYEDANGTHIMSADDICMLDNLPELLDGGVDSLKIEGLLKSPEYNETVTRAYRSAVDAYAASPATYSPDSEWMHAIERLQCSQHPERELSYGFFYKEQVY